MKKLPASYRKRSFLVPGVFTGLLVFIGMFIWWRSATKPLDPKSDSSTVFVIPKGQGIDAIGKRLKEAKLIRSSAAFKLYVMSKNMAPKIQAGSFRFKSSQNLPQIADSLTRGSLDIWVTLLEGWRREEMAEKLEAEFQAADAQFKTAEFLQATDGLEGYLFPDTYLIPPTASDSAVASLLQDTFTKKVDLTDNQSGLTDEEVIILASLLEREVRTTKDRPIIAGILIKRLQNDWPLQVDATVQYIVGKSGNWWPQNLTEADLARKSPYNTYTNPGLPPAPIANPGLASIEAVLHPKSSEYWFYLSDQDGKIHYAKTLEEHNANVAKYIK